MRRKKPQRKIRSPFKTFLVLLVLFVAVYVGYVCVSAHINGEPVNFKFWDKNVPFSKSYQNFVVAGVDDDGYRTDIIMVCQYDFAAGTLHILQIPRDTYVENNRTDKKINSAYGSADKEKTLFEEIETVTGLKADKYVVVSFKGFRDAIDAIGGVTVNVPMRMYYTDPVQSLYIDLYPGEQTLSGKQAEMFMRYRKSNSGGGYGNGDLGRIAAQQSFYESLIDKLLSPSSVIKAPKLLGVVLKNTTTNFSSSELLNYITLGLKMNKENIEFYQLPGNADYINGVSYYVADKDAVAALVANSFTPSGGAVPVNSDVSLKKNKYIKVAIEDASGLSNSDMDLLELTGDTLSSYGFNVVSKQKSDKVVKHSALVDYSAKHASDEIKKIYENVSVTEPDSSDEEKGVDVKLILGSDFNF